MAYTARPGRFLFTLLLAIAACGPGNDKPPGDGDGGIDGMSPDGPPPPHTLTAIVVTPTNPLLELDLNTPGSQAFVATGTFLDGVPEDLTTQVVWAVMNPAVGS